MVAPLSGTALLLGPVVLRRGRDSRNPARGIPNPARCIPGAGGTRQDGKRTPGGGARTLKEEELPH
jgi:hypothetical protein